MPTHSPFPPISIPTADVWTFLFDQADLIYSDLSSQKQHTFKFVRNTSTALGRGLLTKWNWQKGDIMAVFTPNSADIAAVTFGTLWAGGIVCPMNNLYTVGELVSVLKSSGAKGLMTHISCLEVAREAALTVGFPLDRIILIGEPDPKGNVKHFSSLLDEREVVKKAEVNPKEDLAFLVYSSGTTGLPKGVMLSHENIVVNILQSCSVEREMLDWRNDSIISFLPMFHIYGLHATLFVPLHRGLTIYIMPRFDLQKLCETIQTHKVTIAYMVPPVVLLLSKSPLVDKYNLSSLRMVHSAAAPLSNNLIDMFYKRLKVPIKQAYGMSEASPAISTQGWTDWKDSIGSVGKPLPSMSIKIMSTTSSTEVPTGQEGEVYLLGPNIFKGYFQNASATSFSFVDGWFRSGDIGYIDKEGNLYLTDRHKELIKYNGFQVAPAQLEGLLLGHPAVEDVAVVGVYSGERETELPRAYVVLAKGYLAGKGMERDICAWLETKVAPHKRLRGGVRFIDEVPKSAAGKVLRRVLVERAKNEEDGKRISSKL
ncbi:phenylacetyl-CoA ligase [Hyaloscypha variabilis F]|uniref:Phenylacetyl-CoA ligase n=1 Tax=Hyaloscypha variabilis (strain UAMH 11265 / GT02V1 / F) TaxID=1149755 RepID=A0A2J6SAS2_HYAVF|nr:phenylacetyl-CoA ligase [Hyaloscypha variabilis F]